MDHETVSFEERHFVGIKTRIEEIESASFFLGALWDKFHREQIYLHVPEMLNPDFFGVYHDYEGDHTKPYSMLAGVEVKPESRTPEKMFRVVAPPSSYEMYRAIGMFPEALIQTWQAVWNDRELKRTFKVDFEHYGPQFQTEPPEVDLYIGVPLTHGSH